MRLKKYFLTILIINMENIKFQVSQLINDLLESKKDMNYATSLSKESINMLQIRYDELYNLSPSLFKLIITQCELNTFDKVSFYNKFTPLIEYAVKVKNNEILQESASEKVGILLGKEFIPENLLNEIKDQLK